MRRNRMSKPALAAAGLVELGALVALWRTARAAPLVGFERDVEVLTRRTDRAERVEHAVQAHAV